MRAQAYTCDLQRYVPTCLALARAHSAALRDCAGVRALRSHVLFRIER